MTAFTIGDISVALAVGLVIGIAVVTGFKSQHKSSTETLRMLEQQMGPLYGSSLFASGALPSVAMLLVGSLSDPPTPLDVIVIVVLIGSGMIASYVLVGNLLKLADESVRTA